MKSKRLYLWSTVTLTLLIALTFLFACNNPKNNFGNNPNSSDNSNVSDDNSNTSDDNNGSNNNNDGSEGNEQAEFGIFLLNLQNDNTYSISLKEPSINTLSEIVIPETFNDLPITKIGDNGFLECDNLTSISIPDTVTLIGNNAFFGCADLETVSIHNKITSG